MVVHTCKEYQIYRARGPVLTANDTPFQPIEMTHNGRVIWQRVECVVQRHPLVLSVDLLWLWYVCKRFAWNARIIIFIVDKWVAIRNYIESPTLEWVEEQEKLYEVLFMLSTS